MKRIVFFLTAFALTVPAPSVHAFCGFYVAKADTKLFNNASQVVLVRDEDRTVLTMANDFKGDLKEFAIVVPVPTFLEREQIHIGDRAVVEHLDAYTAPRLVEYFDEDPCQMVMRKEMRAMANVAADAAGAPGAQKASALGVKIEASYTVGEYDILILSAEHSSGLETWLNDNGYKMPEGASRVLGSYIKQDMRFFVAKVNLEEQSELGYTFLRPLQVAYESPKFMLPIRLGTLNADGSQELFVYTLTRKGRVETTNYRTVKLPSGDEIPVHVKEEFGDFYRAMFERQTEKQDGRVVFLEYAWDMGWCDPCAADPLSHDELQGLGVFWLEDAPPPSVRPMPGRPFPVRAPNVFVTRLHVRYDADKFPEDLIFQETGDRQNFQGRYVLRHAYKGNASCQAAERYRKGLPKRWEKEAQTLASLTGWDIDDIRARMAQAGQDPAAEVPKSKWWRRIWKD